MLVDDLVAMAIEQFRVIREAQRLSKSAVTANQSAILPMRADWMTKNSSSSQTETSCVYHQRKMAMKQTKDRPKIILARCLYVIR